MIDQVTIDRIMDAVNIVDVVSEFVTLRRRGVNFIGLCPFHTDKTPSFYVSPAKNICKCFACGEGGTAVHFIMKHEQLSYVDALKHLAKKYHIEVQDRELTPEQKQRRNVRESLLIINEWAQGYFSNLLHDHLEGKQIGLRYFIERGFREDIIRKFQLGFSLEQRDHLYQTATKKGYKEDLLVKSGLVLSYDDGRYADRFRGRVIFPVHTLSGKVVAFGGRILKNKEKAAKYVNSPETEVYHKSNELYGIYFAKKAIVKEDRCFLVEGYTDVISMHQAGIENVVASSGTALTQGQIRMIHRFTENITLLYDGDAAGIKAALRGIDLLLEDGMNVKVVLLPDGEDPDSFARGRSASDFAQFIRDRETDFIRFKTKLLLDESGGDPIARARLITDIMSSIAVIPDAITRSVYVRECSTMLEVEEQLLLVEVNRLRTNAPRRATHTVTPAPLPTPTAAPAPSSPSALEPTAAPAPTTSTAATPPAAPAAPTRSPFEKHEKLLIRYIIRYGERILFDYEDEETGEHIVWHVADFIRFDLERDDLAMYTPIYAQILAEAADRCRDEGFESARYFMRHPDAIISRVAANMLSDKYQLSKIHTKYKEVESEEDQLQLLVVRCTSEIKYAYVQQQLRETEDRLKQFDAQTPMEDMVTVLEQIRMLNHIKQVLSKDLGDRVVTRHRL